MFVSTRQVKETVMKRFAVRTGFEPVSNFSQQTLMRAENPPAEFKATTAT
jgi:hypothetical protein